MLQFGFLLAFGEAFFRSFGIRAAAKSSSVSQGVIQGPFGRRLTEKWFFFCECRHLDSSRVPRMISRVHSYLVFSHNQWKVRDNRSVNGVFVNDRKVHESVLRDGDMVVFGGGGNRPLGHPFEQKDNEFKYEFRINPNWNTQPQLDEESEEDTVDGGSDTRQNEDTQDATVFDLDPILTDSPLSVPSRLGLSRNDADASSLTFEDSQSENNEISKKRKRMASAINPSVADDEHLSLTHSKSPMTGIIDLEDEDWPTGPTTKKPLLHPLRDTDSIDLNLPETSNDSFLSMKKGLPGVAMDTEEMVSSHAPQDELELRLQQPITDEQGLVKIAELQDALMAAVETRKAMEPIWPLPNDSALQCKYCRNVMLAPTKLGCGHSLCEGCVECLVIEKGPCPVCKSRVTLPLDTDVDLARQIDEFVGRPSAHGDASLWKLEERNEAIRDAELNLMLQHVISRGIRFIQISERWSEPLRYQFGVAVCNYAGQARITFCEAVGLSHAFLQTSSFAQLVLAFTNLMLPLSQVVARVKPVNGVRTMDSIVAACREALNQFILYRPKQHVLIAQPGPHPHAILAAPLVPVMGFPGAMGQLQGIPAGIVVARPGRQPRHLHMGIPLNAQQAHVPIPQGVPPHEAGHQPHRVQPPARRPPRLVLRAVDQLAAVANPALPQPPPDPLAQRRIPLDIPDEEDIPPPLPVRGRTQPIAPRRMADNFQEQEIVNLVEDEEERPQEVIDLDQEPAQPPRRPAGRRRHNHTS